MHPLLKGALRIMEKGILYDPYNDELYELDEEAIRFLSYCTGRNSIKKILEYTGSDKQDAKELLNYLVEEGLITDMHLPLAPIRFTVTPQPEPSLRYLQLHVTERCNLDCKHCYLGSKGIVDMPISLAKKIVKEFSNIGLKLLITGGEPLLYPRIWELLRYASRFPIRIEVLTNGTLISSKVAKRLARYAHCLQISLDGLKHGHEFVRGEGSYEAAVTGIKNAAGLIDVSVATMIHSGNIEEFPEMEVLVKSLGVTEWNLDIPSLKGNMLNNREVLADFKRAVEIYRSYGFGGETHEGHGDFSCGAHLCSVSVKGDVTKCGFFSESVGNLRDTTLSEAWNRVKKGYLPRLNQLECSGCEYLEACRGGCRFRAVTAKGFYDKDPVMCLLYNAG